MQSGDENIVIILVNAGEFVEENGEYGAKTDEFCVINDVDINTELLNGSFDDNFIVNSEYNEYHGQGLVSEDSDINLESNILLDTLTEVIQAEQETSRTTEHVPELQSFENINFENISFGCTICFENFSDEQHYNAHMITHLQAGDAGSECVTSQVCEPDTVVSSDWDSVDIIEHNLAVDSLDLDSQPSLEVDQLSVSQSYAILATEEDGTIEGNKQAPDIENESHNKHTKSHDDKKFTCTLCTYKSEHRYRVKRHMRTHDKGKTFDCKICGYVCTSRISLLTHIRIHGDKPFICDLCEYKCKYKIRLVDHMRTHTGEKPFTCNVCQYKCVQKGSLEQHMSIHTGVKPHSCNLCDYKCVHKLQLVLHKRTHTGEKPYSCHLCGYKCAGKSYLMSHNLTHSTEKPFSCSMCEFKTNRKQTLSKHMRIHKDGTRRKTLVCTQCNFEFPNEDSLKGHNMLYHP